MRFILFAALLSAAPAFAEPVNIRPDVMSVTVDTAKGPVEIKRIQDNENKLEGDWAKTSRPCPSFCIQPMIPAPGVTPVGELEMMEFLKDPNVVVVDGRVTRDFEGGAIPGAINIPYMEAPDRLGELGCQPDFEGFICDGEDVKSVALYCNGPWCGQSPTAARRMIEAGFPAEKIYYYRGGMQQWRLLGLTVSGG
ncbi:MULTISPECIES: rhodanese-like domain-containing protein [Thioclava]|uniref:rhodanese-like domain-containing protein n=1 Tax=Thioclava TaxID=285107 RepID=UPI000C637F5B|nr:MULTISPECIES: rhodanese-like domain-containing protein [Thioclava]MAQ38919.1 sulfurtransferase [Thioclava sp.]|tara:strand:+ start:680 stop:1264 length:585 start_codon:yes stop_codon:yes gene_type:complete